MQVWATLRKVSVPRLCIAVGSRLRLAFVSLMAERVPITPTLFTSVLWSDREGGEEEVREDYELCQINFEAEAGRQSVYTIPISFVNKKLLVAAPYAAWSRTLSERILPRTALTKAVLVELEGFTVDDFGGAGGTVKIKAWVRYLRLDLAKSGCVGEADDPTDVIDFEDESGSKAVPFAEPLVNVANELFAFHTATSGLGGDAGGQEATEIETRFTKLEEGFGSYQSFAGAFAGHRKQGRSNVKGSTCRKEEVPWFRSRGFAVSPTSRHTRGSARKTLSVDAETHKDGRRRRGAPRSQEEDQCPVRVRGGRGGRADSWRRRRGERAGCGAGSCSIDPSGFDDAGREEEEEIRIGGNPGESRFWWRWRRRSNLRNRTKQSRCLQEAEGGAGKGARMALQKHRAEDGGRFPCEQECTRSCRESDIHESMDRTQKQTPTLPIYNQNGMDRGRDPRLPSGRPCFRSTSEVRSGRGGHRPIFDRHGELDALAGISSRRTSSILELPGAKGAGVVRTGNYKADRREVPGDHGVAPQGSRQLPREQEKVESGSTRTRLWGRSANPSPAEEPGAKGEAKSKAEVEQGERPDRGRRPRRVREDEMRSGEEPGKIRVPGAAASTMHAGIWDLAFSALLRARTGISKFLHSVLANRSFAEKQPEWQVWPTPLPFPEVHLRAKSRRLEDSQRKLGINYVVTVLNWLSCGERQLDVSQIRLGCKLNKMQWSVVKRLRPPIDSWNRQGVVGPTEMGRSAPKVESVEAELRRLEEVVRETQGWSCNYFAEGRGESQRVTGITGHPGDVVGRVGGCLEHVAKDVEPDRLKFHEFPSFNPEPFLDYGNRRVYSRPLDHSEKVDPEDLRLPRVKISCRAGEKMRIVEKLDEVKRLALLPARSVRRGLENGLFSLVKDAKRDRMILDARRPNFCEVSERRWIYTLLLHVFLEPTQNLYLHAEDLREFYHCFKIGEQRRQRNILQAYFKPAEVQHLAAFNEELWREEEVVAALDTLAMGDTNAVAFGQVSHLSLLLRTKEFQLEDFFGLRMRPSRKRWKGGLVIDDFLVLEARAAEDDPEEVRKKVERVREAYVEHGLPRHPDKAVEGELRGEFWGGELDGEWTKSGRV